MSTKRESKQPVPSVIARLMGLDEMPPQQPVQKKPRVLSENYLCKVASIGVRENYSRKHSFKLSAEELDECQNVLQVLETLRKKKRHVSGCKKLNETNDIYMQSGHDAVLRSTCAPHCRDISMCMKFSRKCEQWYLNSPMKVQNGQGIHSSRELHIDDVNNSCRSNSKLNNRSRSTTRTAGLNPQLGQADSAARCFSLTTQSHDTCHPGLGKKNEIVTPRSGNLYVEMKDRKKMANGTRTVRPRSRFLRERTKNVEHGISNISRMEQSSEISNDNFVKESKSTATSSPILPDRKSQIYCSDGSHAARGPKKQISERWKTNKKFQQVELAGRSKIPGEMLAVPDNPGMCSPISQGGSNIGDVNFNTPLGISSWDSGKNEHVRDLPRSRSLLACFNAVESPNSRTSHAPSENVGCMRDLKSINLVQNKSRDVENDLSSKSPLNHKEHQSESRNWILSAEEEDAYHIQDSSVQQEISTGIFEVESVSSQYSVTDPESLMSAEEAYQPSPNSVLEPLYKKEISPISDCFKGANTSFHGLHMQLELLKSETLEAYSEVSSIMVSSDEDSREGSVNDYEENDDLMRSFRVEESRDFSYLVDVLEEACFHNINLHVDSFALHSQECTMSYSVFEILEKKYSEQISWKRLERKLLFDRINSGLVKILQPSMVVLTQTKPVARKLSFSQGHEPIEEELWMLLVNQEKEVSKESEKFFGKDDGWLELDNDIQIIGREIENSLIDELVADVTMGSF